MKTFLFKTLLFVSLIIGGALATDHIITEGLKMSSGIVAGEVAEWNKIVSSRLSADVIISGNSRAGCHYIPAILDSVLQVNSYCLGIGGAPFSLQLVKIKLFEKYNTKPKVILQEVGWASHPSIRKDNELLPFINEDLLRKLFEDEGFSTMELCLPAYRYDSQTCIQKAFLEYFHLKHFPGKRIKGHAGFDKPWKGYVVSQDSIDDQQNPEIVELFDAFLNESKKQNIQVILVFSPQYIKKTEHTKNWNKTIQVYRDFAKKYDIPFLDYTHDPICNDTTYFFDAHHLNNKGAELFSLKLAHDIKEQNLYK